MANKYWIGTDVGNEGNWQVAANWNPSGVPGADDYAFLTSGSQSVTAGLTGAATVKGIITGPDYSGDIAASGGYLDITCSEYALFMGSGDVYLDLTGGAGPTDGIKVRCPANTKGLHLKCGTGANDVDLLVVEKGLFELVIGTVAALYSELRTVLATDVAILQTAGTITTFRQLGGTCTQNGGTITNHHMHSGTTTWAGGTVTNLDMYGGVGYWKTIQTLAAGIIWGGIFDAGGDVRAKTITSLAMHGEAQVNIDNGNGNVTIGGNGILRRGRYMPVLPTGAYVKDGGSGIPI